MSGNIKNLEESNNEDNSVKKQDENKCTGCLIGACGQEAHMDCPYGCLHDKKECILCELDEDSILCK